MGKVILFIGAILFMAISIGCNKECSKIVQQDIETIIGPPTGNVNSEIKFTIGYTSGDCDSSPRFEESQNGLQKSIKLFEQTTGCICTMKLNSRAVEYKFTPTVVGTYMLSFSNKDGSVITHSIMIQ